MRETVMASKKILPDSYRPSVAGVEVPPELISEWYKKVEDAEQAKRYTLNKEGKIDSEAYIFEELEHFVPRTMEADYTKPLKGCYRNASRSHKSIDARTLYWKIANAYLVHNDWDAKWTKPYHRRLWELYCSGKHKVEAHALIVSKEFGVQVSRRTVYNFRTTHTKRMFEWAESHRELFDIPKGLKLVKDLCKEKAVK